MHTISKFVRTAASLAVVLMAVAAPGARAQSTGSNVGGMWPTTPTLAKPTPAKAMPPKVARTTGIDSATIVHITDSVVSARVAPVEQTLRDQADTIAALRMLLAAATATNTATPSVVPPSVTTPPVATPPVATPPVATPPVATPLSALELTYRRIDSLSAAQKALAQQVAASEKSTAQRISGLGNFRFSGDVRVRYEGQFQDGGFTTRHRERSRARLGITGNLTDALTGGMSIASGALDDVQSVNQTQTGFFSRKTIGFDRFYVQWKPRNALGFGAVAGKFTYPWERTSLTFGNDINPEGISTWLGTGSHGPLTGASLVGFALPLLEVAGDKDSYVAGGQLQTRWRLGARTGGRLSLSAVDISGADAILLAANAGTIKPSSATTNTTRVDSAGKVMGFATDFRYVDAIVAIDHAPDTRWRVATTVNVVRNVATASGQNTGLFADLRVGRLAKPNDWQGAWTVFRIERDAVVGALNEQDLRAATNVINHRGTFSYQWRSNASLAASLWLGRLLEPVQTGKLVPPGYKAACTTAPFDACRDPWLKRLQIDLSYKY